LPISVTDVAALSGRILVRLAYLSRGAKEFFLQKTEMSDRGYSVAAMLAENGLFLLEQYFVLG